MTIWFGTSGLMKRYSKVSTIGKIITLTTFITHGLLDLITTSFAFYIAKNTTGLSIADTEVNPIIPESIFGMTIFVILGASMLSLLMLEIFWWSENNNDIGANLQLVVTLIMGSIMLTGIFLVTNNFIQLFLFLS